MFGRINDSMMERDMDGNPLAASAASESNTVAAIPLPNEIPQPPDLSSLPNHILHSGTVETLIGQNEDLMARLKVNIRRNAVLEQQLMEQDRVTAELSRTNGSLMAQMQVFQEKTQRWREKSALADALQSKFLATDEDRKRLMAFHRRIQLWVRPMVDRLKVRLASERARTQTLETNLATRDAMIGDLRAKLSETILHAQSQEKSHIHDQAALVEQYESRVSQLDSDLSKARAELKLNRDKALRVDEAVARQAESENRVIYFERKLAETEHMMSTQISELQTLSAKSHQEAKTLALEILEYDRKLSESTKELAALRDERNRIQDQFESMQALWHEAQRKLEASRQQHEAMNRINQELSRQLKEDRMARGEALPASLDLSRSPDAARVHELDFVESEKTEKHDRNDSRNENFEKQTPPPDAQA